MILKRNLFFLFAVTLFAMASTTLNVFNFNPYESESGIFVNFYTSFFIACAGIISFIIYFVKLKFYSDKNINAFFWPSIRLALLISVGITAILILKGLGILDWWVGGPLVIAVILLELFFQTSSKKLNNKKTKI